MEKTLKPYQVEAAKEILGTLSRCREDWQRHHAVSSFALSATTGSGKTVIAAAVIESLLFGSNEFETEADPGAVVLWISQDRSLNEQTRDRILEWADRIPSGNILILDKDNYPEELSTAHVYFLNTGKLGIKGLMSRGVEGKPTFWTVLDRAIRDRTKTLYVILDEAHEGVQPLSPDDNATRQTIVMKIINGNGENAPAPIVMGISATVKRFDEAMAAARERGRENKKNVVIDPRDVQASGLLKNGLVVEVPREKGNFETTMVREAVLAFIEADERWTAYSNSEELDVPVVPLLVIQIPNKTARGKDYAEEDALVRQVLDTVRKNWPGFTDDCVAHVLGDRLLIEVGPYVIPHVEPQDIEARHDIRVLVAKDAISTGWDCPRAEVLVSLRPGREYTYIAQLLGRMVRTPLARETGDELLNTAWCFLPNFDRELAKDISEEITGIKVPGGRPATVPRGVKVYRKPVTLWWNGEVPIEVRQLVESLPSYSKPPTVARPIKRLLNATPAFAQAGFVKDANIEAHEHLKSVLDGFAARYSEAVDKIATQIMTADTERFTARMGAAEAVSEDRSTAAEIETIEDSLRQTRRDLTTSVVNYYLKRLIDTARAKAIEDGGSPNDVNLRAIRARVAAISRVETSGGEPTAKESVENAADALVRKWLAGHKRAISRLPESRIAKFDEIRGQAREPENHGFTLKEPDLAESVDGDYSAYPTLRLHMVSSPDGDFPTPLNAPKRGWERAVVHHEVVESDALVGWYRNPDAATQHALRIAYKDANSEWRSMQPDFLIVERGPDGTLLPSIIDPHGAHQSDSLVKLRALADYAEEHGDLFARIESIGIEKDGMLYSLDLKDSSVKDAVRAEGADAKALYETLGEKYGEVVDPL